MPDVLIERHPRLDEEILDDLIQAIAEFGMTAEAVEPTFLGKGSWELVLELAALPADAWLVSRILDRVTEIVQRRPRDERLRRIVFREPQGEELGSVDLESDRDEDAPAE